MTIHSGRSPRRRVAWGVVRVVGALGLGALVGSETAERRGVVLGVLAFLLYGVVMAAAVWSPAGLRRWSARHVLLDRLFFIPLAFFALLLIPALPWWGAALIALVAGAMVVALVTRRHNRQRGQPSG